MSYSDKTSDRGEFLNNELIRGERTYIDGTIEEGAFLDDRLHSAGSRKNTITGTYEIGMFHLGVLNGHGVRKTKEGVYERGIFQKGLLSGKGIRILSDKTVEKGIYIEGKLHQKQFKARMTKMGRCWTRCFGR